MEIFSIETKNLPFIGDGKYLFQGSRMLPVSASNNDVWRALLWAMLWGDASGFPYAPEHVSIMEGSLVFRGSDEIMYRCHWRGNQVGRVLERMVGPNIFEPLPVSIQESTAAAAGVPSPEVFALVCDLTMTQLPSQGAVAPLSVSPMAPPAQIPAMEALIKIDQAYWVQRRMELMEFEHDGVQKRLFAISKLLKPLTDLEGQKQEYVQALQTHERVLQVPEDVFAQGKRMATLRLEHAKSARSIHDDIQRVEAKARTWGVDASEMVEDQNWTVHLPVLWNNQLLRISFLAGVGLWILALVGGHYLWPALRWVGFLNLACFAVAAYALWNYVDEMEIIESLKRQRYRFVEERHRIDGRLAEEEKRYHEILAHWDLPAEIVPEVEKQRTHLLALKDEVVKLDMHIVEVSRVGQLHILQQEAMLLQQRQHTIEEILGTMASAGMQSSEILKQREQALNNVLQLSPKALVEMWSDPLSSHLAHTANTLRMHPTALLAAITPLLASMMTTLMSQAPQENMRQFTRLSLYGQHLILMAPSTAFLPFAMIPPPLLDAAYVALRLAIVHTIAGPQHWPFLCDRILEGVIPSTASILRPWIQNVAQGLQCCLVGIPSNTSILNTAEFEPL